MRTKYVSVCAFLFALLMLNPLFIQEIAGQTDDYRDTHEFLQLVVESSFESPPSYAVNGTSDEFSYGWHMAEGGDDYNYSLLNWTHEANTSLDFKSEDQSLLSDCNDYVHLYKDMVWNYEVRPRNVIVKMKYEVNRTGDFESDVYGDMMFSIFIWFVDSMNDTIGIFESSPPYSSGIIDRLENMNYFEIRDVFHGMIESSEGVQEDPLDLFSVHVALAPTNSFLNHTGSEPWRSYNGSVLLKISNLEVHVAADIEEDIYDDIEPVTVGIWGSPYSDFFPRFAIVEDGSAYGVVTSSSYEDQVSYSSMVKWDSIGRRVWYKMWNDSRFTTVYDIAYHESYIYTVGREIDNDRYDAYIAKWNLTGSLIWKKIIDTGLNERGEEIIIGDDGSIYVMGNIYNNIEGHPDVGTFWGFFGKYDSEGNHQWNITTEGPHSYEILKAPNGEIYTHLFPYYILTRWASDGSFESIVNEVFTDVAFGNDGSIFTTHHLGNSITELKKWTHEGNLTWSKQIDVEYPYPWFEATVPDSITIHNESIYLIVKFERLNLGYSLMNFDLDGNQIWNKTILDQTWAGYTTTGKYLFMEFGENGLLYIGGNKINPDYGTYGIAIARFNPENVALPTEPISTTTNSTTESIQPQLYYMLILAAGSVGVVTIVILVIYLKKRTVVPTND